MLDKHLLDKPRLKISQGKLMPLWLRILVLSALFAGIISANINLDQRLAVLVSMSLAMPVFPLWNSYQLLEIDTHSNKYRYSYWIAGINIGKWHSYREIDKITVTETNTRGALSFFFRNKAYEAFLIFKDTGKIYLIGNDSLEKLQEMVLEISAKLNLSKTANN